MESFLNEMLEEHDVMCRIGSSWYKLDSVHFDNGKIPIMVSDEDGGEHEYDMSDIDEFDPIFMQFKDMDTENVGIA